MTTKPESLKIFLNQNKGAFIKIEFEVLNVKCSKFHNVNGFFIEEAEVTSTAICGTHRTYLPIYSQDNEIVISFYSMLEEVRFIPDTRSL